MILIKLLRLIITTKISNINFNLEFVKKIYKYDNLYIKHAHTNSNYSLNKD